MGPSLTSDAAYGAVGDLSAYMDYGNMHNYFAGFNPGTHGWGGPDTDGYCCYGSINYNLNITRQMSGSKPIMTSETGYVTNVVAHGVIPYDIHAKYALRMFFMQFLRGVERTLHYEFCDYFGDGTVGNGYQNFGIVEVVPNSHTRQNKTLIPKPAYYALQNVIKIFADPGSSFTPGSLNYSYG